MLERNNHPSRDGHFIQPTLTKAMATKMAPDAAFNTGATFTGSTWASPLYLEKGPGGKGVFFAVTFGNDVIALDETTGATVWKKSIGTAATGSNMGCSFSPWSGPLGIISTPVIDEQAGVIYVAGDIGDSSGIKSTILTALDVMTGDVKAGWPVDLSTKVGFDAKIHIQRSALSLVGGVVYVAFGGYVGDCGNYQGRVVAVSASDPTQVKGWATGAMGEGIWPAGGMASDGKGIFVTTGNTTPFGMPDPRSNSESVVRITGMATFDKANTKDFFYPANARDLDTKDLDVSSSNAVFFPLAGGTPSRIVAAFSKDGKMFLLDADNLGGMGKQLVQLELSKGDMTLYATPTVYSTPTGVRLAVAAKGGAVCPSGGGSGAVMAVSISAASPPIATTLWCAAASASSAGQPISTTTDGKTDAIVWIINNGKLNGFDGETGTSVTTGGSGSCANVRRWTSPIAVKGRIVAAGDGHLCSWSAQ